ncbi:unnamed protein product [Staurois parvus]|uniref:Uncharacterized protein n=1 Tax=Staurois parvus TaxID=386267 RepID=A0ABN9BRV4_9NEOB|nr:unnamed protein product [Staurois parvus]
MGPCTASSCCCQARNLSWAPVPPPHAAARSRVCHGSLYGLPLLLSPSPHSAMCHFQVSSHCWWVPFCHRVLADYGPPIAAARPVICHGPPYRPPHAAARPVICHGPLYRLLMLLPGPECVMGPCTRPPIAAVSIATLCHVPLSGLLTLLVGSILS